MQHPLARLTLRDIAMDAREPDSIRNRSVDMIAAYGDATAAEALQALAGQEDLSESLRQAARRAQERLLRALQSDLPSDSHSTPK